MDNKSTVSGISFFGAMFLLFLGLKLSGIIAWSWWWITIPLWGPLLIAAVGIIICIIYVIKHHD